MASIRQLYNSIVSNRKIGSKSNAAVPLTEALFPCQRIGDTTTKIGKISDIFTDSPAFEALMVKLSAYDIVENTTKYDIAGNLLSANVIWLDGFSGTVTIEFTDSKGSFIKRATRNIPGTTPRSYSYTERISDFSTVTKTEIVADKAIIESSMIPFCYKDTDASEYSDDNTRVQSYHLVAAKETILTCGGDVLVSLTQAGGFASSLVIPEEFDGLIYVLAKVDIAGDYKAGLVHEIDGSFYSVSLEIHVGDGTVIYPYPIAILAQLDDARNSMTSYYKQYADIDMLSKQWEPIGQYETPFTGNYDGNGKVLTNLLAEATAGLNGGLFGSLAGATVANLSVLDAVVSGVNAGIIVGSCAMGGEGYTDCTLTNLRVSGSVTGTVVGGIVGQHWGGDITNCHADVVLLGVNCGGIVAQYIHNTSTVATISLCSSTGSLRSDTYGGGILGTTGDVIIQNCYSNMTLIGTLVNTVLGGIVGYDLDLVTFTLEYCYAACVFENSGVSGGILGERDDDSVGTETYTELYWDSDIGAATSGAGVAKTTDELKVYAGDTFAAYAAETWFIMNGRYPTLQAEK